MDKEINKPLLINGKEVVVETRFIAEKETGVVEVTVEIDLSQVRGKDLVAFEKLLYNGEVIASHEDINDESQTIKVTDPKGKTYAEWENGTKEVEEGKTYKLIDRFDYKDLIVGKEYKLIGYVVLKENGKTMTEKKEVRFMPQSQNGSVNIEFEIDTKGLDGKELVVFEEVHDLEGNLLIDHKDINDKGQTVKVLPVPDTPYNPNTGDTGIFAVISTLVISVVALYFVTKKQRQINR